MTLQGKNILLVSSEPWDNMFVSKHHYAIYLGKRSNKVFFLNPPSAKETVVATKYENVFSVTYGGFPMGLRFYTSFLQKFFIREKFNELQNRCGVLFDLIWSFDDSVFFDFTALPKNVLRICHIVDFNQDFQLRKSVSTADYCFCPSDVLKEKLSVYNPKTFKIRHGYSIPEHNSTFRVSLPGKNHIKVFYAGNLDIPYIDWSLLNTLISVNSDVDFCFAGSKSDSNINVSALSAFDNFYYLGQLNRSELPSYLDLADIMLLTYRADEFREQLANPHKAMEYLASGKVLVATYTEELQDLHHEKLICMSNSNAGFPSLFSSVLKNLFKWNSPDRAVRRKQYALENTYAKQIERIELILKINEK